MNPKALFRIVKAIAPVAIPVIATLAPAVKAAVKAEKARSKT
jgi:hypothetical protein